MVFPVVMYGCESWTIKKAECWIIDAFELWGWRRLLRIHWIAMRPNQSTLKKINSEYSFIGRTDAETEAPILWPPDTKSWLIGKDPDAGKDWRQRAKRVTEDEVVGWHHWLNRHELGQTQRWWGTGKPGVLQSMGLRRVGHDLATEQQQCKICKGNNKLCFNCCGSPEWKTKPP